MSRPTPRRRTARWRLIATALTAGLLLPGAVVSMPAYADSETLNPLDQSTQFDEDLPVLEDSLVEGYQRDAGGSARTDASGSRSAAAALKHLGPCKQDFIDVAPGSAFYPHVTWMACDGLTNGYQDHSFGVSKEINRGEAALMIYRMSGEKHDAGTERDFKDVKPVKGEEEFTAISWMAEQEIVHGYDDGTFRPDRSISRGELASYLFRYAGDEDYVAPAESAFKDVPTTLGTYPEISWMHEHRMVKGYVDGTFRPTRNVTRGETSKYLYGLETLLHGTPAPPATAPKPAPEPEPEPEPQPDPEPEIPLAYRYVVIADDGLNVRSGAGANYGKVASLARNTKVVWTGRSKSVSGATWREITVRSVKGWVHGGYLMRDFEAGNAKSALSKTGTVRVPKEKWPGVTELNATWEAQPNGYWCGPASVVIALDAFGINTNQTAMAEQAQTDRDGTWLHQVARLMDYHAPASVRYEVTTIPGSSQKASYDQRIRFRDDMVRSIKAGVPGLVNIAATPGEQAPLHRAKTGGRFTLRHHMPVTGYDANTNRLLVLDPWTRPFWVDAYQLADMTVTRGYASLK
ncbi:SH3 domain-containing protein [Cellulosimicrobium funkei]|nr:SH3 domain-containing protein [Cellulosimicrobium funkei]